MPIRELLTRLPGKCGAIVTGAGGASRSDCKRVGEMDSYPSHAASGEVVEVTGDVAGLNRRSAPTAEGRSGVVSQVSSGMRSACLEENSDDE